MRRAVFGVGEYYHVYNRGVEKRDVFMSRRDYERFLFDMYAMNDRRPFLNSQFHYRGLTSIERLAERRHARGGRHPWQKLVDIVCFCLLPNHFHFILRQAIEGGISLFMQKLGTAYTMYFNERNARTGGLFQGTYKAKHVASDRYFLPLTRYIHLNPLDLLDPGWKERGVGKGREAQRFIVDYPWSSYADFIGTARFPRIVENDLTSKLVGSPRHYQEYVSRFRVADLGAISDLTIEV